MNSIPLDTPQKQCTRCKKFYPPTNHFFYVCNKLPGGFKHWCKPCCAEYKRNYRPETVQSVETKQCSKCKKVKHANDFPKNSKTKDGLDSACKECWSTRRKRSYRNNQTKQKKRSSQYHKTHREECIKRLRANHQKHYQERIAYSRQYEANPVIQKHRLEYRKSHHAERRIRKHQRRATEQKAQGNFTGKDIQKQYDRQKGKCYYCQSQLTKYHVDHIIPLTRGGTNDPSNLVITCPHCNMSKHNKLPHEWHQGNHLL